MCQLHSGQWPFSINAFEVSTNTQCGFPLSAFSSEPQSVSPFSYLSFFLSTLMNLFSQCGVDLYLLSLFPLDFLFFFLFFVKQKLLKWLDEKIFLWLHYQLLGKLFCFALFEQNLPQSQGLLQEWRVPGVSDYVYMHVFHFLSLFRKRQYYD